MRRLKNYSGEKRRLEMRVLIIKLSSMGDLMHAFPALTEAAQHYPDITFDWVVDEGFSEVPLWHPNVKNIITTAHRRWRKQLISSWRSGQFRQFYKALNANDYDAVVDLQSNLKSATVSWLRTGAIHGYDGQTCREKPAHWAYQHNYHVPLYQHAIERQRQLLSRVLGYSKSDNTAQYGVDLSKLPPSPKTLPEHYVIFVHNASWETKLWPTEHWKALLHKVVEQGYSVLLPCGNDIEFSRAKDIANDSTKAIALPKVSLSEMASIMYKAKAAVCCDTGLAHMAAVASTPAITLYAVTDTVLIGTHGKDQHHISAGNDKTASMQGITVQQVWEKVLPLL